MTETEKTKKREREKVQVGEGGWRGWNATEESITSGTRNGSGFLPFLGQSLGGELGALLSCVTSHFSYSKDLMYLYLIRLIGEEIMSLFYALITS